MPTPPFIRKLGTIDLDMVEVTPFVHRGRLYRAESVRRGYRGNRRGKDYLRVVEHDSRSVLAEFAENHCYCCAFVEDDTVHVVGTDADQIHVRLFASRDLRTWQTRVVLDDPRYRIYNTSLCRADSRYVLSFEISEPIAEAGVPFTARFATSTDLAAWTVTSPECVYAKDRYTAPHMLRWHEGFFYLFYLEAIPDRTSGNRDGARYKQHVVRSADLVRWTPSPVNPVLAPDPEDKLIANPALSAIDRQTICSALDCNNSDIDVCEFNGRVAINYSWGDQVGHEFLAEAAFDGTLANFLSAFFPA